MAIDGATLLPPASTALERALARVTDRVEAIPFDLSALWSPTTCPIELLPWLGWSLSVDRWDPDWTEERKRAAVASAIADQRVKGSRASIEAVLASFDDLLQLVEWFEASPQLDPYTFEIRLPLIDAGGAAGGERVSAKMARAIVADVARTKPARAHFTLIQSLELAGIPAPIAAVQVAGYRRLDMVASDAADLPWSDFLQDQNGEPFEDDAGNFIDGTAP